MFEGRCHPLRVLGDGLVHPGCVWGGELRIQESISYLPAKTAGSGVPCVRSYLRGDVD